MDIDRLTGIGRMQRELDALNPLKLLSASARGAVFDSMNNSSVFAASSAIQQMLDTMRPLNASLIGGAGIDYWQRLSPFQLPQSLQHTMESLSCTNAIKDAMALRNIAGFGAFENVQKMLGAPTLQTLQKAFEPLAGIHELRDSITEKVAAGLGSYEAIRKSMDTSFLSHVARQAPLPLLGLNSLQESLGFRMSSVQSALKALHHSKIFSDADYMEKAIGVFSSSKAFRDSIVSLNYDGVFQEALNHYNSVAYALSDEDEIPADELAASFPQMEAMERGNFLELFRELPPFVQSIIIFIFMQTIWPMFINVASALITPNVERMINGSKLSTDQVRVIKKLPASQGIDIENLRFVTRNNVKLRAKASTKSEVLDELVVGQVVTVLSKKKNWAEVVYRYDDGQSLHGWILTTYTARFKLPGRSAPINN